MASSRFIDWLTNLTAKSTTIDGTEITHIGSSGLSQKATTKDLVSYVSQNLAQVWNAGSTVFTAIKMNVTDTSSSASSLLMDLQVGGVSKFKVTKDGGATFAGTVVGNYVGGSSGVFAGSNVAIYWDGGGGNRAYMYKDANAIIAQRDGTTAQEWRVYGTYTDASNYRRLTYKMSDAGVAVIKPEGAGTGASGNVLHISGLPTSNPGPGILWNNGGNVAIGT